MKIDILDHGFIELVDHMGGDLTVVNAARVSFGKRKEVLDASDEKLIKYLIEHKHMSPVRQVQIQLHCKTVEYLARQIWKHCIGIEYSIGAKGSAWNELCYSDDTEIYTKNGWKLFSDLTSEDEVAAVDISSNSFTYERPSEYHEYNYSGKLVKFESRDLDLLTTPSHRHYTKWRSGADSWSETYALRTSQEILNKKKHFEKLPPLPSLDLVRGNTDDYWDGFTYGFCLGDGGVSNDGKRLYLHVKRPRKKDILEKLETLGLIKITNREATGDYYYARVNTDKKPYFYSTMVNGGVKSIAWDTIPFNKSFLTGLLDGLISSDGHITSKNCWSFSSGSHQLIEDISNLSTLLGREVAKYHQDKAYQNITKISIKHGRPKLIRRVSEVEYCGKVYCVSVSTGVLMVRRNMKVAISGNSGRYVNADVFDFYTPNGFRKQSPSNKQASTNEIVENSAELEAEYKQHVEQAFALYSKLVNNGVAKEQARGLLPLCFYTEFYWTISLEAAINFIKLRKHEGAQYEIRLLADALEKIVEKVAPITMKYLLSADL